MKNPKLFKKSLIVLTSTIISISIMTFTLYTYKFIKIFALTLPEIQAIRKENKNKIVAIDEKINNIQNDKNYEQQQNDYLKEQITIIQENINILNAEIKSIGDDILKIEHNINDLNLAIKNKETLIYKNIDIFKKRLYTMYINKIDLLPASLILGSSNFYDIILQIQIINRVAKYDNNLINKIVTEIESLKSLKATLESEKFQISIKLNEQQICKNEKKTEFVIFNEKMLKTQYAIELLSAEHEKYNRAKDELQADINAINAEENAILEEITRQKEATQQRWEYEQHKKNEFSNQSSNIISASQSGFLWPVPGFHFISSFYEPRWESFHYGIDISDHGILGSSVIATQGGTVITVNNNCIHNFSKNSSCGCGGGYGNYVTISHDGIYSTLYGHLTKTFVSIGQYINQGEVIGTVGTTGWSTGPHLHFEVIQNGIKVDPLIFVNP